MFLRIFCRFVGHRRSAVSAHRVQGAWHSRCKRCGAKLIRVSPSNWEELKEAA
jgi:hypothetical protein